MMEVGEADKRESSLQERLVRSATATDKYFRAFVLGAVVAFGLRVWTAWPGGAYHDDVSSTYAAIDGGFGTDYLLGSYNGHWGPFGRLLAAVLVYVSPFDHHVASVVTACVALGAQVLVFVFLRRLLQSGRLAVVLSLAVSFSTLYIALLTQWSVGLLFMAMLGFGALVGIGYLKWVDDGEHKWLYVASVAGILGLLTDQQFLIYLVLVFVLALLGTPRSPVPGRPRRQNVPVAAVLAGAIIAYPTLVSLMVTSGREASVPTLPDLWNSFYTLVLETFLPSLLGGPWLVEQSAFPGFDALPGLVISQVGQVTVACILLLLLIVARSWIWLLVGGIFAVGLSTVTAATVPTDVFGQELLREGRFAALLLLPVVTCIGLAATDGRRGNWVSLQLGRFQACRWSSVVVCCLVLLAIESVWVTTYLAREQIAENSTASFWSNIEESFAEHPDVAVVNRQMPEKVLSPGLLPEVGQLSEGLRYFVNGQKFGVAADQFWVVESSGNLAPAEFTANRTSPPGPNGDCGYAVTGGSSATIPTPPGIFNWEWVVKFDYLAAADGNLQVRTSGQVFEVGVKKGLQTTYLLVAGDVPDVVVSLPPDAGFGVCVASISVGTFQPTP